MSNNFTVTNLDTDSISVCKPDGSPFTEEEKLILLKSLNDCYDPEIRFADDGYFPVFIVLKAKNYIMRDEKGKIKLKGSALKSSTLEPKLKEMNNEFIDAIVNDKLDVLPSIYHKYIKQASSITDIKPWAKKLTLSETTFNSQRTNETKVIDAIKGTEYKQGDKVFLYTKCDKTLGLAEQFNNDYDLDTYLEKLFKATLRFETILDIDSLFKNYKLKRNKSLLYEIQK